MFLRRSMATLHGETHVSLSCEGGHALVLNSSKPVGQVLGALRRTYRFSRRAPRGGRS
jgi:hypothetical protein